MRVSRENLFVSFAAITGAIASLTPWPAIVLYLSGNPMWDRTVYITKIQTGDTLLSYFHYKGMISYFTYEYLWAALMNALVRSNSIPYQDVFALISAAALASFFALTARRSNLLTLVLLVNPLVIDLVYSQLRMALALSILYSLILLNVRKWYVFAPLALVATMVHTAMPIFILAHLLATMTGSEGKFRKWSPRKRLALLICYGILIGVAVGPLRDAILSALHDRRAHYIDLGSSLRYLSYWIFLYLTLLLDGRRTLETYESRYSICILGIIFVNAFSGFYSLRFIAAAFPFLVVSTFSVFGNNRLLVPFVFILYSAFQWYFYVNSLIS